MQLIPVILCGGSGTRLWPASRDGKPKQFLALMNERSLLQNTAERLLRLPRVEAARTITVSLAQFADETAQHLEAVDPALLSHIVAEPSGRNTAAAMALAALYAQENFGEEALLAFMPSDHHIGGEPAFAAALEKAMLAAKAGYIALLGVRPSRAETGYGYIAPGAPLSLENAFSVQRFIEKPGPAAALEYANSGAYLWNSGIYLCRADTLLAAYAAHAPDISGLAGHALSDTGNLRAPSAHFYDAIRRDSFEKAVLERMDNIAVVKCEMAWSDIGSWTNLWEAGARDENGNMCITAPGGEIIARGAENCLIHAQKRLVACIGVQDIVVIETEDAVLVAAKDNAESLRKIVADLQEAEKPRRIRAA
jgi:mannose-1-phosphate guanylyltransferase